MTSLHRTVEVLLMRWAVFFLSLYLCNGSNAGFTVVVPGDPVSGLFGSSVSLPCELSPALNAELLEVRWYRPKTYETPVLLYKDQQILESSADPQFRGRVSLIGELKKGNVSLKLNNLKLQDGGDYMCNVNSGNWYDEVKISVKMKALGSVPVLSIAEERGGQINVSCLSSGWFPKPSITWRDNKGKDLTNISKNRVTVSDPEGFVSVSSWLLVSPSESEWISCSVSLSDLEVRESRILPHMTRESRTKPYITAIVFLIIISLLSISAAVILFLKQKRRQVASNKDDKEKNQNHNEEMSPLNPSSYYENENEHEIHETETQNETEVKMSESKSESQNNTIHVEEEVTKQAVAVNKEPEESNQGSQHSISHSQGQSNEQVPTNPIMSSEENLENRSAKSPDKKKTKGILNKWNKKEKSPNKGSHPKSPDKMKTKGILKKWNKKEKSPNKVNITIDPQEVPQFLKIKHEGRSIYCPNTKAVDDELKIFALCKEKFSTGKHYWEVKVCDKSNQKLSWYVGVADETAERFYREEFKPENGFWVLCYDAEHGLYINDGTGQITFNRNYSDQITTVGLCLDCDRHTLTFYDVDYNSLLYMFKLEKPNPSLCPLISPGVRDTYPVQIITK